MEERFKSCGLNCGHWRGRFLEISTRIITQAQRAPMCTLPFESDDKKSVLLDAIFRKVPRSLLENSIELSIFHLRPDSGFPEKDGQAKYQIFRISAPYAKGLFLGKRILGSGYVYVVLDELKSGADLGNEIIRTGTMYRLRGISDRILESTPTYDQFNRPDNWVYWNTASQDFDRDVVEVS